MKTRKAFKWAALATCVVTIILISAKCGIAAAVWACCAVCFFSVYKSIDHQEDMENMTEPIERLMANLLTIAGYGREKHDDNVHSEGEA